MILLKKALRSIWRGKRSYAACIFLIALGMASYVGFTLTGTQMVATMDSMYKSQRFGEAFASVKGISPGAAASLTRLDGIAAVTARTTVDARVLHDGDATLSLAVQSIDPRDPDELDAPLLTEGALPGRGQVVVSPSFLAAQGYAIGDTIALYVDGRQMRPVISGTVISPAFISGDSPTGGYAYMLPAEANTLADNSGLADSLSFRLDDGMAYKDVEVLLEDALARYGLKRVYARVDHTDHENTWMSFRNLFSSAGMISFIFLTVAAVVLYILLRRVIEQERIQIGTMKAFGLSGGNILLLYMGYGGFTGLIGGALGVAAGLGIAHWFSGVFLTLLRMPAIPMVSEPGLLFTALLLSVAVGLVGSVMGARAVLKLSPAEAMRPAAPSAMKKTSTKDKKTIVLPLSLSMALRNIGRGKFRSAFVAMGMAVSFAILTFMSSYGAVLEDMLLVQFDYIQHYDMKLTLKDPQKYTTAVQSAATLPGVENAEGTLELPVTLYHNHLHEEGVIMGFEQDSTMEKLYDSGTRIYVDIPPDGAVLSQAMANKLDARVGDTLQLTAEPTGDDKQTFTVSGIVGGNLGLTAYMELGSLCTLLQADKAVNGLLLATDSAPAVKELLADAKNVDVMTDQQEQRQAAELDLNQSVGLNVGIFAIIGLGIAFAIIASSASISLSERSREYATLRVLGMGPGEIGRVLILEYLILTAACLLPGIPLSLGMRYLIVVASSSDTMTMSMYVAPIHFVVGGAICLLTALIANLSSIRQIAKLDMTDVLKERD